MNHLDRVLDGYLFEDCDPIRVDSVRFRISLARQRRREQAGRPIKLRFHMAFASLYELQLKEGDT